ncbi:MAG TPA: hypothetical protein VJG32_02515 [Anaerolineae bacterium]|nr:hypothetical protein [Anaerolineae bacterium]
MQAGQVTSRRLTVDFFSHSHRISTQFLIRARPLADTLNDHTLSYVDLDIAYVSRIDKPGELIADYTLSILRKENISFCLVAAQIEMAVKQLPSGQYFARRSRSVFCTVPSFEITGLIDVPGNVDLHKMMAIGVERFMPIYKAKATISLLQSVSFSGELILVNKERIQVLCLGDAPTAANAAAGSS